MKMTSFTDRETKERAIKNVYSMLVCSYMGIAGGFLYSPMELLTKERTEWHTGIVNGKLICVIIVKHTDFGKKIIMCGCDGTRRGKMELMKYLIACIKDRDGRYYCEASGVIEHWLKRHGVQAINNKKAREILRKEVDCLADDGIHYVRKINGVLKEKAIYGNI